MKLLISCLAIFVCGISAVPLEGPQCEEPNGGGLRPVLQQLLKEIPTEKLLEIYMEAVSNDEEVQAVMEYISSEEFIKIIVAIHSSPEYDYLMKYACDELYLDVYYYFDKLADLLGWPIKPRPPPKFMFISADRSPGFRGMLADILEHIPVEKLKGMIEEAYKTNNSVKLAIDLLRSDKFVSIVGKVKALDQYKVIIGELNKMGFDVEKILKVLKDLFGW